MSGLKARLDAEAERRRRLAAASPPPFPWLPFPASPQERAYRDAADVVGYGGAAGGGKTDLEIGLALAGSHYKSIIFRREFVQLRDVVFRAKEILDGAGDPGRFNGTSLLWQFKDGRTLELGAVQRPDDWRKYRGRPHDFIGIDEATEFLESQVRALMGWLRSTRPGQKCRVVMTFNPPTGSDGMWVIRYFAPWLDPKHPNPANPGEPRYFAMVDGDEVERPDGEPFDHGGERIVPQSRTFYPAKLSDNPALRDTGYGATLQSLPEPLRSQLLFGDFQAGVQDDAWQILPTAWYDAAVARWTPEAPGPMTHMGVDVAHGGADKTVIARRHGRWVDKLSKHPGSATPDGRSVAALVVDQRRDDARISVDAIGYGASAAERLMDPPPEGHGIRLATAVNVARPSEYRDGSRKFRMVNLRAEMYWRLRDAIDPESADPLALPPDRELRSDLLALRYEVTTAGIKVEKKDDLIDRLGRSPDCGEAVALSMLEPRVLGLYA